MSKCEKKIINHLHKGNSFEKIKYAIHCKDKNIYNLTLNILKNIGFITFKQEKYGMFHTFMNPPKYFHIKNFYVVIVISKNYNKNKLNYKNLEKPHIGFRVQSIKILNKIYNDLCNLTKTLFVNKPDELSLYIDLKCGEIIELSTKIKL